MNLYENIFSKQTKQLTELKILVTITNSAATISSAIAFAYAVYFLAILNSVTIAAFNFSLALLYSFTLYISSRGKTRLASYWLLTIFMSHIFLLATQLFSPSVGFHFYLLTVPTAVFLIFRREQVVDKFIFTLIAVFMFFFCHGFENSQPYVILSPIREENFFAMTILIIMLETFVVMSLFLLIIAKSEEQLSELATKDPLTNINNRRTFMSVGDEFMEHSKRYHKALSLLLIDIDHFKKINDLHGHLAGDQVLIQVAKLMQDKLRSSDCLARYGGEEFVILLPETDAQSAFQLAQALGKSIEFFELTTDQGKQVRCTVSTGISQTSACTSTLTQLLDQADIALYQAKEAGRNRAIIFEQVTATSSLLSDHDSPQQKNPIY